MERVKLQFFVKKHQSYWYSSWIFCEHLLTNKHKTKITDLSCQRQHALFCFDSQGSYLGPLWSSCLLIWYKYVCYWKIPTGIYCPTQWDSDQQGYWFLFSWKVSFDISCELSAKQMIHMKCHCLLFMKNNSKKKKCCLLQLWLVL